MRAPSNNIAIVVPVPKSDLTDLEEKRLRITVDAAGTDNVFLVGPNTLDWSYYRRHWHALKIETFDSRNFQSVRTYNHWILKKDLYERFLTKEFVVICQTDALLVRALDSTQWDFDYLGAVWDPPITASWDPFRQTIIHRSWGLKPKMLSVGNGGLSIRRTMAFIEFIARLPRMQIEKNEDVVISYFATQEGLRCASPDFASSIFLEQQARDWTPGTPIPPAYGFHALNRINPELELRLLEVYGSQSRQL